MGYSTDFDGQFKITPPVTDVAHAAKLWEISSGGRCPQDEGAPRSFCMWELLPDGSALKWDGGEKFYYYTEWLKFLIDTYLTPWGHAVNGAAKWSGEDVDDAGVLVVYDNKVEEFRSDADTAVVYVPRALLKAAAPADGCPTSEALPELALAVIANARKTGAL